MITLYKTSRYEGTITPIACQRETDSSYWDERGNRHPKLCDTSRVYESFDLAKRYLVDVYATKLAQLNFAVLNAEKDLDRVKALQPQQ